MHIIFPRVAAPIAVAPPVLPTKMIVDTSLISLIIAVKIIGDARFVKGASLVAVLLMNPGMIVPLESSPVLATNCWTSSIFLMIVPIDKAVSIGMRSAP